MPTHKDLNDERFHREHRSEAIARTEKRKVGELLEESYRRGYRDGFVIGLGTLYNLLNDMDREMAHEIGWEFWLHDLNTWMKGDCTRLILPPAPPGQE